MGRTKQNSPVVTNRVRELRQARQLPQQELASALHVSRQTINSVETGRYVPSLPLALELARFFGLPVEEIFHVAPQDTEQRE
jgi:putative transcriptional regulator